MSTMLVEIYDALKEAGASEEKARAAATSLAGRDQRWDEVDGRFQGVEQRLDGVERRLDLVEQRLDGVERRLDLVEQRLDGVERRLDLVEHALETLTGRVAKLEEKVAALERTGSSRLPRTSPCSGPSSV